MSDTDLNFMRGPHGERLETSFNNNGRALLKLTPDGVLRTEDGRDIEAVEAPELREIVRNLVKLMMGIRS